MIMMMMIMMMIIMMMMIVLVSLEATAQPEGDKQAES